MSTGVEERKNNFQDTINKKVLIEWIRITGMQNPKRKTFDKLLQELARDILKYPSDKPNPFSWPTGAGISNNIPAIRVKINYEFWRHFLSEGRTNLLEYNKTHNTDIKLNREQTLQVSDMEKLGLYLRKFIRDAHNEARRRCPEIVFKKGMLNIGREYSMTPTMAAYQFNINMDAWRGLPLEEMMSTSEKTKVQNGEVTRGSLRLTGINLSKPLNNQSVPETSSASEKNQLSPETSNANENSVQKRPLQLEENEENPSKLVKN